MAVKKSSPFCVLTNGPDDWRQFLADPVKQWKTGYSAKELAYSWETADGFPSEVQAVLDTQPVFDDLEILSLFQNTKSLCLGGAGLRKMICLF